MDFLNEEEENDYYPDLSPYETCNHAAPANNSPTINLFLVIPPINQSYSPYSWYNQQSMNSFLQPNQYAINYPQNIMAPQHKKTDKESNKKHHKSHKKSSNKKESKEDNSEILSFDIKPTDQFDGIFKYLTTKTGGNIHDNGTINITSNSYSESPKNVLDSKSSTYYDAKSGATDFWICFDFKKMKVKISNYTVKSYRFASGHLKNWVLEISDDNENWSKIDEHSNDSTLNDSNKVASFSVKSKKFARYVRIRHIGEFWAYMKVVSPGICAVEFYGKLKLPKS